MNMIDHDKEVITEEREIDNISNLPTEILNEIFKDMSFRELAKTCVLSKKWKYFWAMHPVLVLDGEFLEEISRNRGFIEYDFNNTIDMILLQHVGPIVKFVLDLSTTFGNNLNLDHWVLHMVIFLEESANYEQGRFITWSSLLYICSNLTRLVLSKSCIGLLGAEIIPKRFPSKSHHLEHVKLRVDFGDINHISGVLSLIRSSPTLRSLEIDVFSKMYERSTDEVIHYLKDPNCVDQPFEKLEYVEVTMFEGTPCEIIFLKLMLAHSPSLSRMIIGSSDKLDVAKVLGFHEQLTMFLKASPRVELIVAPYGPTV
ncbi:hypothetical protein HAX54_024547 [Datura stramonium]|uniref:F-box domain-containing protein n=1 Tax=Datura stramonium TaxID=4076 RepID=A0ABS8S6F3_DATST|nr:hypothetical protein [Datura stramonium]